MIGTRKPSEFLRAARELISVPERWTKGSGAYTRNYFKVDARNADAVCWCALGAIAKVRNDFDGKAEVKFLALAIQPDLEDWQYTPPIVADFNDAGDRAHPEILAAFDKAIILAEQSEAGS